MEERTQHRTRAPVRLRFVLNSHTTDLAVPAHAPLVDVLSTVLPMLNPDAPDHGAEHDGFVVARLTGPPLDEERTPTELELLDGETLYLRPRAPQLPPVMFDDLVDGVAEQVRGGSGVWTPARSAARATASSPCDWAIRVKPVGASITGIDAGAPKSVVDVSIALTSTSTLGRNSIRPNASLLRISVRSSSAPPSM